jgi:hypothetical protein
MRLRNRREARSQTEPSNFTIAGDGEVDSSTPVTWSVDQLNALGPVTGPSHRTFVPIVRSTLIDNSLGDQTDSSFPLSQP